MVQTVAKFDATIKIDTIFRFVALLRELSMKRPKAIASRLSRLKRNAAIDQDLEMSYRFRFYSCDDALQIQILQL